MAGFNTAVTGLKSASQMLDVAGNNIANSSTVGFKSSRTEFADIYATSVVGAGASNQPGSGVTVSDISQDFSAGTIEFTNNNLDLAINGSGFFQLDDGQGGITYTRAGTFELDKDGFIVSKNGKNLQGYGLDALGNQLPLQDLAVTQKESAPKATETIDLSFNIDSSADATQLAQIFDKADPGSYTYSTTVETVDSLGNSNSIRFYVVEQRPVREVYSYDLSELTPSDEAGSVTLASPPDLVYDFSQTVPSVTAETFSLQFTDGAGDAMLSPALSIQLNQDFTNTTNFPTASDVYAEFEGLINAALDAYYGTSGVDYVAFDGITGELLTTGGVLVNSGAYPTLTTTGTRLSTSVFGAGTLTDATPPATENLSISGIELSFDDLLNLDTYFDTTTLAQWRTTDPRIDTDSLVYDPVNGTLSFETFAFATQSGDMVVGGVGIVDDPNANPVTYSRLPTEVNLVGGEITERPANRVEVYSFDNIFTGGDLGDETTVSRTIDFAGVSITLSNGLTQNEAGAIFESYERALIARNPDIESFAYSTTTGNLTLTWKADAGDVDPVVFDAGILDATVETTTGDNTYQAQYRMYGFLNDTEQLNLGKIVDPGEPGFANENTEVGPILVNFDPTTGTLAGVNGSTVATGGTAPRITILGADPANPNDDILESDVDSLAGIQLDITGTTQFASESIVKAAAQDGYPKGDLIGVTFAETGEMVASFSNGQRQNLGLVAIASFENQAGLSSAGSTEWIATLASGAAILNPPGTGLNGTLRSAALESSNVDLSAELVKLIEAQRNFQANSKTLETQNTVTQAILQI